MKKIYSIILLLTIITLSSKAQVVINEVYGGGGNNGATYKNDFIELYNNGNTAVNLTGWSVQYASATGISWQKTVLNGSIAAHGYYLIQEATSTGGTLALPTPDASGSISMSATAGKVALVNNSTTLTGTCPTGVVDFVGFGAANCFEGNLPTTSPTNPTSAQRSPEGYDTNVNGKDFKIGAPTPMNSATVVDVTPPAIAGLFPANNSTNNALSFTASITFDENVLKGTNGTITVKSAEGNTVQTIDLSAVTVSGKTAQFAVSGLDIKKAYYIEISNGAFKDAADNIFAGITGNTTWSFDTYPIPGILDKTYAFNTCTSVLPDGFTQFSATGAQVWGCTTYGRNAADMPKGYAVNGIQINGYVSNANNANEDWFISPGYDLTATNYPLLSFYSRTAFAGDALLLKVSTDYPGYGDPRSYTWNAVNGRFPALLSDSWYLSENINLAAYKSGNVYFAFVYTSTDNDGARWTLDDITLKNSATPPPPALFTDTKSMSFPYTAVGASTNLTFTFNAYDITNDITLTTGGVFLLSKDGASFGSSITFTPEEANIDAVKTVYVRFSPNVKRTDYTGEIQISSTGISSTVSLAGTSINPENTLEVANWNMEWFGSPTLGPTNDNLQEQNALTVFKNMKADIYCVVEVVDENRLKNMVAQLPGYDYKLCNYGSHTNPTESNPGPLSEAQKLAFVYRTDMFSNTSAEALLSLGVNTAADLTNPDFDYWASGRFPYMLNADVTLNCETKNVKFILVHAKANTSPIGTSYERRKAGADDLHAKLMELYPNDNIVILGDFNDDFDQSITAGYTTTSWNAFTEDTQNFTAVTLPLSLAGDKSTASYNDVIDHVVISNEMNNYYLANSADIRSDIANLIAKYATTTSDHYPVLTRYMIPNVTAPVFEPLANFTFCKSVDGLYQIPQATAKDDCNDAIQYTYTITGATTRSGEGNNASGNFSLGSSVITWTATDDWGNQSNTAMQVTVSDYPVVAIPDAYALATGVEANTVYLGYAPASSLTLTANVNMPGVTYEWSNGSSVIATSQSITVSPKAPTTYTVTVINQYGCATTFSKFVNVIDVRGGNKMDKVVICHKAGAKFMALTVAANAIPDHLSHGDYLGACAGAIAAKSGLVEEAMPEKLSVEAYPNPSTDYFTVVPHGINTENALLKVTNILGKVVETAKITNGSDVLRIGSNYPSGIYFIEISNGAERVTAKVIKR